MSTQEKRMIERQFLTFTARHFEKPSRCKNIHQIRYYIAELSQKIDEFKSRFNYVPNRAYVLLSRYNATQNSLLLRDFVSEYGTKGTE